eukprot:767534-Hanusia_phi.AAC.1
MQGEDGKKFKTRSGDTVKLRYESLKRRDGNGDGDGDRDGGKVEEQVHGWRMEEEGKDERRDLLDEAVVRASKDLKERLEADNKVDTLYSAASFFPASPVLGLPQLLFLRLHIPSDPFAPPID